MSVLIKGMTMPKCCDDCQLLYDCFSCIVTGYSLAMINWDSEHKRLTDCPLIELPDHGDLIDRDALKNELFTDTTDCDLEMIEFEYVSAAPVVIPGERSEE